MWLLATQVSVWVSDLINLPNYNSVVVPSLPNINLVVFPSVMSPVGECYHSPHLEKLTNYRGGSRTPPKKGGTNLRFAQKFLKKTHEIEKVLGHRGAHARGTPLRSTTELRFKRLRKTVKLWLSRFEVYRIVIRQINKHKTQTQTQTEANLFHI